VSSPTAPDSSVATLGNVGARWATIALLALFVSVCAVGLATGSLAHVDEYRTAERSREMLLDLPGLTVHENFEPSFQKPPLQYWLTALTLRWIPDPELATRVWSLVFGVLLLMATAWLTHECAPEWPWSAPLAVGLLIACDFIVESSRMAMLDMGMMFFTVASLAAVVAARRDARYWLVGGALASLGLLQKAPVALAAFFVATLWTAASKGRRRAFTESPWPLRGWYAALGFGLLWPAIQFLQFGPPYVSEFFGTQMVDRFSTMHRNQDPLLYLRLLFDHWQLLAVVTIAAVIATVLVPRLRLREPAVMLALWSLVGLGFVTLSSFRSSRYVVVPIPTLAVVTALACASLPRGRRRTIGATALALMAAATFVHQTWIAPDFYRTHERGRGSYVKRIAKAIGRTAAPDDTVVLVRRSGLTPARLLFYGELNRPVTVIPAKHPERLLEVPLPVQGVVHRNDLEGLLEVAPNLKRHTSYGRLVHWSLDGMPHAPE